MWVVLSNVVAVGGLMRVMSVNQFACRHVLLSGDVTVAAAQLGTLSEGPGVGARQRVGEVRLVLERHPDQKISVTATRKTTTDFLPSNIKAQLG